MKRKIFVDAGETLALTFLQETLKLNGLSLEKISLPSVGYIPSVNLNYSVDDHHKICSYMKPTLNDDQNRFVENF